jgi:hypothetical protein
VKACARLPLETPAEHFRRCGPFCSRVRPCPECVNIFGVCEKHREEPDGTWLWSEQSDAEKGGES